MPSCFVVVVVVVVDLGGLWIMINVSLVNILSLISLRTLILINVIIKCIDIPSRKAKKKSNLIQLKHFQIK